MPLPELLPEVRALSRIEKLQLIRVLAEDLAGSEEIARLSSRPLFRVQFLEAA
jgi:hypothetical protein